jgi:hypothetical protein
MLAGAALLWITLDADVSTPRLAIGRGWSIAAVSDVSFRPLFVYPDFQSGVAAHVGFRLRHHIGTQTTLALTGRMGTTYVDDWRPVFEGAAELSWREGIEVRAGLRHDDLLRREGTLAGFRDPTGRVFFGASVLPLRRGPLAAGAAIDYERALPGAVRLPSAVRVTLVGRFHVR